MSGKESFQLSDLANDLDSSYIVRDAKTGELITGCFVLRPIKERLAFLILEGFFNELGENDLRKERLGKFLERIGRYWI